MFAFKRNICIIISEWKYFAPIGMLYNVLLPITAILGTALLNATAEAASDNRELTRVFH